MKNTELFTEQKIIKGKNGLAALFLILLALLAFTALGIAGIVIASRAARYGSIIMPYSGPSENFGGALIVISIIGFVASTIMFAGLKTLKPNEALVLTLFGKYFGTLEGPGFFFVNPFVTAVNPIKRTPIAVNTAGTVDLQPKPAQRGEKMDLIDSASGKAISLKIMTLDNNKQKINDKLGNPIEIGVVIVWRVVNAAKAVFNVDNYFTYLSTQADSSLRNIVRLFPYDVWQDGEEADEMSLRGSSQEIAVKLREELQSKVEIAGLEIVEARITHLAYAPEIAAAMLQRQQASAIIDARKLIVEGAVGMVDMALQKLSEQNIVELDAERKAAMVSNLLVVLCGNKEAQPIVNSGSIY